MPLTRGPVVGSMERVLESLESPRDAGSTAHLVLWWDSKLLYSGLYADGKVAAHVAEAQNGVVISFSAEGLRGVKIQDFYMRDDAGCPMPATWRTINSIPTPS